jgi:hypothetical protein
VLPPAEGDRLKVWRAGGVAKSLARRDEQNAVHNAAVEARQVRRVLDLPEGRRDIVAAKINLHVRVSDTQIPDPGECRLEGPGEHQLRLVPFVRHVIDSVLAPGFWAQRAVTDDSRILSGVVDAEYPLGGLPHVLEKVHDLRVQREGEAP